MQNSDLLLLVLLISDFVHKVAEGELHTNADRGSIAAFFTRWDIDGHNLVRLYFRWHSAR